MQEADEGKIKFISHEMHTARYVRKGRRTALSMRRGTTRPKRKRAKWTPLAVKAGICALTALVCLLLRLVPARWAQDVRNSMFALFTYDLKFDETLGRLEFVQAIFPGAAAVFGTNEALRYPADGVLQSAYGEDGRENVVFQCEANASIKAVADGRVQKRGVHPVYGNYLMIEHAAQTTSIYYNLGYSVLEQGATVKGGDVIGTLKDDGRLVFELRISGVAQNPMRYLGSN